MEQIRRRILAIGAHPDDLELGCGGTLAKMNSAGFGLSGLILTRGERGGDIAIRTSQSRQAADFLGLSQLKILEFTDTRLVKQELEVFQAIEDFICDFKPDVVLTHSEFDLHQDHVAVHKATLRAARNISTVLCYESPYVTQKFNPTLFIQVEDYIGIKFRSVWEHRDQSHKPYTDAEQIYAKLVFRGSQARVNYAEGFEVVRILSSDLGGI
ncbi:MAG TPA: PIG-L deacetylase family protein [Bacillota bacterium]|nr:PIG-L deacetylase family protein [Bacillota bacterium]